jgi:hypothetical protein
MGFDGYIQNPIIWRVGVATPPPPPVPPTTPPADPGTGAAPGTPDAPAADGDADDSDDVDVDDEPDEPTVLVNDNDGEIDFAVENGRVTLYLGGLSFEDIIEASEHVITFDLTRTGDDVTSASFPTEALIQMADAGLGVLLILPTGTVFIDDFTIASLGAQAADEIIEITIEEAYQPELTAQQQNALVVGDTTVRITVTSGDQYISEFSGSIFVTLPFDGEHPVGVWRLNPDGYREQLPAEYMADLGAVMFSVNRLSVFVVGHDPLAVTVLPVMRFVAGNAAFTLHGATLTSPAAPFVVGNDVMVPLRIIVEAFGANVDWNPATRTVTIFYRGATTSFPVDVPLPHGGTPTIVNNSTFVPLQFISGILGVDVRWDGANRVAYVYAE